MIKQAIYFLALFSLAFAIKLPVPENFFYEPDATWEGPRVAINKTSEVIFHTYATVTAFYVNNNKMALQFSDDDATNNHMEKEMDLALFKGDIITIVFKRNTRDPQLVGIIRFYDRHGQLHYYSTDNGWYCNGKKSVVKGRTTGANKSNIIANWISADAEGPVDEVSCSFKIPCHEFKQGSKKASEGLDVPLE